MTQQTDWHAVGREILSTARAELYLNMPFLDAALGALRSGEKYDTATLATDGARLFWNGAHLAGRYERARSLVCRAYLHLTLHCLLRHPGKSRGRDEALWDLCCDIAVESIIDGLGYRCLTPLTHSVRRRNLYESLQSDMPVLTAEAIYRRFRRAPLSEYDRATLAREFYEDDHTLWYTQNEDEEQRRQDERWQQITARTQTGMETVFSAAGAGGEAVLDQLRVETREKTDYRAFLHRFAVLGEEVSVDPDAFDYGYYAYGLRHYGNMPLIEPLETREAHRIEDFVVAIDTSMSTSGELVRAFLSYTYAMLRDSESFFRRVNLRILQCDDRVRADKRITSADELADYMADFELTGGSATDFRPVFDHVAKLQAEGAFRHLRGLLYFTDGLGVYPAKRPPYDAAFVMLRDHCYPEHLPPWAIRVTLSEDEILPAEEETI